jgi:hypothetical protein
VTFDLDIDFSAMDIFDADQILLVSRRGVRMLMSFGGGCLIGLK